MQATAHTDHPHQHQHSARQLQHPQHRDYPQHQDPLEFHHQHQHQLQLQHYELATSINTPYTLEDELCFKSSAPRYRYLFGGMASVCAVLFTHPFDLVKVHAQTTTKRHHFGVLSIVRNIFVNHGHFGFYHGISGGILREGTYSTTRFAMYHLLKDRAMEQCDGEMISTTHNICLGLIGGAMGGLIGNPADIVNVRLLADIRLPVGQRRNYKHSIDGLLRIGKEEGSSVLLRGVRPNVIRAMLLTTGQIGSYDVVKNWLMDPVNLQWDDDLRTHIVSSLVAGLVGTTICAPADVIKTRLMSMKSIEYKSATDCMVKIVRNEGVQGLFKGWTPAYMRLGPQTILTFVFMEQFRKWFL